METPYISRAGKIEKPEGWGLRSEIRKERRLVEKLEVASEDHV